MPESQVLPQRQVAADRGVGFRVRERHKDGDSWLQNDPETTQLLGDECLLRPPRWRRMEPISYRATPAFYPHTEQFIIFAPDERDLLLMLQEGNESELASFASGRFGLGATPPTDAEILEMLRKARESAKVSQYERVVRMRSTVPSTSSMADDFSTHLREMVDDWKATPGLIPSKHAAPPWLMGQINRRAEFGSRYDPLVLAVEHEALRRSKLSKLSLADGRSPFVRFNEPDIDLAPRTPAELHARRRPHRISSRPWA